MSQAGRRFQVILLTVAPVAAYWKALGRHFVSEDFLHFRILSQNTLLERFTLDLVFPWMGVDFVLFYRPLSTLIQGTYLKLFGLNPLSHSIAHLSVHILNTLLFYKLACRLLPSQSRWPAFLGALLFSLYPLHANTVSFLAAVSVLHSTAFILLCLVFYIKYTEEGSSLACIASFAFFAMALGIFEMAVITPVLIVGLDLALPPMEGIKTPTSKMKKWAPYFSLLPVYFGARYLFLGKALGGYGNAGEALIGWKVLVANLTNSYYAMLNPTFDGRAFSPPTSLSAAVLALAVAGCLLAIKQGTDRRLPSTALLGLAWTAVCQAPFLFVQIVPGNARYWYLATGGLVLSLLALSGTIEKALRLKRPAIVFSTASIAFIVWIPLLAKTVGHYEEAGRLSRIVISQIAESSSLDEPVFLSGIPSFIRTEGGAPAAQVFHWGVKAAMDTPFHAVKIPVNELPPMQEAGLGRLAMNSGSARLLVWNDDTEDFAVRPIGSDIGMLKESLDEIEVFEPEDGTEIRSRDHSVPILVEPAECSQLTLYMSGAGWKFRNYELSGGSTVPWKLELPASYLKAQSELSDGRFYWWVEARDASGRFCAVSRLRLLVVAK